MPEPEVEAYLRKMPATDRVRAAAWNAVYAGDDAEIQKRLGQLPLPQSVKADLWKMAHGNYEAAATPEPRGVAGHLREGAGALWETVNPMNIVHAVNQAVLPEPVGKMFGYEESGPINTLNAVLGKTGGHLRAAGQAALAGQPGATASHLMSSVPIAGPFSEQVGRELEQGDYGKAGGRMLGVAALAAPQAYVNARNLSSMDARMTPPSAQAPRPVSQGAARRVADVMSPRAGTNLGRRMGNQAQDIAPQMVRDLADDGAPLSRTTFHAQIRERLAGARTALDDAADQRLAARSVPIQPLIADLRSRLRRLTMNADEATGISRESASARFNQLRESRRSGQPGTYTSAVHSTGPLGETVIPGPNAARARVLQQAIGELERLGPTTTYDPLRVMRQAYDGQAEVVYNPSVTADFLTQKGGALGAADVTGVLREHLARLDPATARANAQFSLYKTADDVMSAAAEIERARPRVGRQIMARLTGVLVGAQGGPAGMAAGYIGGPILDSALASGVTTQLKTAALLQHLTDAVKAGDIGRVSQLTQQLRRTGMATIAGRGVQPAAVPAMADQEPER